ncbi:MAG: enoyl-CoA hydratase-related protein [Xanthomonadales bacterium]|nr:enoyl-CoA hydratase-related protein [Xanthomonadales bacterium]
MGPRRVSVSTSPSRRIWSSRATAPASSRRSCDAGLVPDGGGAYLLARSLGPHRAKELLFYGDALDAAQAERMGLVNRVVAPEALEETVTAMAERLAAGPTRAIALTKGLVNRAADHALAAALADEAMAQDLNMQSADAQEGVDSFVERREPVYRGW